MKNKIVKLIWLHEDYMIPSHNKYSSQVSYKMIIRLAHRMAINNVNADNMKYCNITIRSS